MTDEATRKRIVLEYCRRMNAGDVEAVLELFADDIVFEDPVGGPPIVGMAALRRHITWSIGFKVHETPGRPVASMDDRTVVMPVTVTVRVPSLLSFNIVGVIQIGEDGLVHRVQAFWGLTDTTVGDAAAPTGAAQFTAVTGHLTRLSAERFGALDPAVEAKGGARPA